MHPNLRLVEKTDSQTKYKKIADNLFLNTSTQVYYVRKSFKRFRIPELFTSTHETKVGKAKSKAAELIQEHLNKYLSNDQGGFSKRQGKTVRAVIDEVLATVTPTRRKRTQENHALYLGELKKEWGRWDISKITLQAWTNWLVGFRARKKRSTFADYAKDMNLLLRYAYRQRYVSHLLTLPNPDPVGKVIGRVFTKDEISGLWAAMNEETRDQFILCYECFMRLREALYLTWDRVNLETGVITLRPEDVKTGSKTGKGRSFRISDHALKRLQARAKTRKGKSPFVFPSPSDRTQPVHQNKTAWKAAKKKAKVMGRARWHDLRHTALSRALLELKADIVLVSEYAGVSVKTLQRVYLHATHEHTREVSKLVKI